MISLKTTDNIISKKNIRLATPTTLRKKTTALIGLASVDYY
jgi:hypothetical protein